MKIEELAEKLKSCANQAEIARRAGVTRAYISAIANNVKINPTIATMNKIIAAVDSIGSDE